METLPVLGGRRRLRVEVVRRGIVPRREYHGESKFIIYSDDNSSQIVQEKMPAGIYNSHKSIYFGPVNNPTLIEETCANNEQLGYLNTSLSKEMSDDLALWKLHDENLKSFCDIEDEESSHSVFVDLLLNPEKYTGSVHLLN